MPTYGLEATFNLPDINWEEEAVNPYATNSTASNQMLNIVKDSFLEQMVTEPTRITETTSNVLDLFFTSNSTLVNKVEIIPGISDHEAVFIESSLKPMKVNIPPRKVYQYRKADYNSMKQELRQFQQEFEARATTQDVETLWADFRPKYTLLWQQDTETMGLQGS